MFCSCVMIERAGYLNKKECTCCSFRDNIFVGRKTECQNMYIFAEKYIFFAGGIFSESEQRGDTGSKTSLNVLIRLTRGQGESTG